MLHCLFTWINQTVPWSGFLSPVYVSSVPLCVTFIKYQYIQSFIFYSRIPWLKLYHGPVLSHLYVYFQRLYGWRVHAVLDVHLDRLQRRFYPGVLPLDVLDLPGLQVRQAKPIHALFWIRDLTTDPFYTAKDICDRSRVPFHWSF